MSLSPENLDTVTVLLAVGCIVSLIWNVAVEPSLTSSEERLVVIWTLFNAKLASIAVSAEAVTVVIAEFAFLRPAHFEQTGVGQLFKVYRAAL